MYMYIKHRHCFAVIKCYNLTLLCVYPISSMIFPVPKEVTVAIIKPDAVKAGKVEEILEKVTHCKTEKNCKAEPYLKTPVVFMYGIRNHRTLVDKILSI